MISEIVVSDMAPQNYDLLARIMKFHRANKEAMTICNQGVRDYVASRCLILSELIPEGLTLSAQAVEKVLKAQYRVRGGNKQFGGRNGLGHDVPTIARELQSLGDNSIDLSNYSPLIERLVINYELRYPDNRDRLNLSQWLQSSAELDEIDELVLLLFDNFPVPAEVNYLTCYFGVISDHMANPQNRFIANDYRWLTERNNAIANDWTRIKSSCETQLSIYRPGD